MSARTPDYALINARLSAGLSQKQLGAILGVSREAVAQWEGGYRRMGQAREEQVYATLREAECLPEEAL